jgi:putative DNA primase/helicase
VSAAREEPRPPLVLVRAVDAPLQPGTHPSSDLANAERFAHHHGEHARFVSAWGWLRWDGVRWRHGDGTTVEDWAEETQRSLILVAAAEPDKALQLQLLTWAKKSQTDRGLRALLKMAEPFPSLRLAPDVFDADPLVLNTPSGLVDLRTGALRPPDPAAYCTRVTGVGYDPDRECPRFRQFLKEVFQDRPRLIAYVVRALGYALTGRTSEDVCFFAHGRGRNGKSLLLELLRSLLGDYGDELSLSSLTKRRDQQSHDEDLARLVGRRFVTPSIELNARQRLNEGLFKRLTGGDALNARLPYGKHSYTFRPQLKLWIACNHLPRLSGEDDALWHRIHRIPFAVKFSNEAADLAAGSIPAAVREELLAQLLEEGPAILGLLVRGAGEYLREGLNPPKEVTQATEHYRRGEDQVRAFVATCCGRDPKSQSDSGELGRAYEAWHHAQEFDPEDDKAVLTATAFGRRLTDMGFPKTSDGHKRQGLRLLTQAEQEELELHDAEQEELGPHDDSEDDDPGDAWEPAVSP